MREHVELEFGNKDHKVLVWLEMRGYAADMYLQIGSGSYCGWINKENFDPFRVICKVFDYAKPQAWFEEYIRKYGEVPHGVWCYDEELGFNRWGGGFLDYRTAYRLAITAVSEALEKHLKEKYNV